MRCISIGRFCSRVTFCSLDCIRITVGAIDAYNRFLMERIIPTEPRLKTLLYLPFCEPKECERMVAEFAEHPDMIGFMVTSVRYKSVHHDSYMRLDDRGNQQAALFSRVTIGRTITRAAGYFYQYARNFVRVV